MTENTAALERDRALWARWRDGDLEAGDTLFSHYDQAICRLLRTLGASTPDLLDDCYSDLVLELTRYSSRHALRASFFGLARRVAIGVVSRRRAQDARWRELATSTTAPACETAVGDRLAFHEALDHCVNALRRDGERLVFRERILLGCEHRALAATLGKSPNHVAVLLSNALRQMRACLEKKGFTA